MVKVIYEKEFAQKETDFHIVFNKLSNLYFYKYKL